MVDKADRGGNTSSKDNYREGTRDSYTDKTGGWKPSSKGKDKGWNSDSYKRGMQN